MKARKSQDMFLTILFIRGACAVVHQALRTVFSQVLGPMWHLMACSAHVLSSPRSGIVLKCVPRHALFTAPNSNSSCNHCLNDGLLRTTLVILVHLQRIQKCTCYPSIIFTAIRRTSAAACKPIAHHAPNLGQPTGWWDDCKLGHGQGRRST